MGVYVAGALWSVTMLKEGASTVGMVEYTSHYATYFEKQSRDFMDFSMRIPVNIHEFLILFFYNRH